MGGGGLAQVVGISGTYDGTAITGLVSAGGCCFTPPNDNLVGYSGPGSSAGSNLGSNAVLDLSGIAFGIADGTGSGNNEVNVYTEPAYLAGTFGDVTQDLFPDATVNFANFTIRPSCQGALSAGPFGGPGPAQVNVSGATIRASVTPTGTSLAGAAAACGVTDFNWQQTWVIPSPSPFKVNGLAISGYSNDPPPGGWDYERSEAGYTPCVSYPFYYGTAAEDCGVLSVSAHQVNGGATLLYNDTPSDPCIPLVGLADENVVALHAQTVAAICGGEQTAPSAQMLFYTTLVGVGADGSLVNLPLATQPTFTWESNYDGQTGGAPLASANDALADSDTGTGGVTLLSVDGVFDGGTSPGSVPVPEPEPFGYFMVWIILLALSRRISNSPRLRLKVNRG